MRRFAQSETYARTRALMGLALVVLGAVLVVRTVLAVPLDGRAAAPLVMGLALVALGVLRIREFMRLQRRAE